MLDWMISAPFRRLKLGCEIDIFRLDFGSWAILKTKCELVPSFDVSFT